MDSNLTTIKASLFTPLQREFGALTALVLMLSVAAAIGGVIALKPAPPSRLTFAVSTEGGARHYVRRYAKILARDGIEIEIREASGATEAVRLLADEHGDIDAAIFPSGTVIAPEETPQIESLGALSYVPIWIFTRGAQALEDPHALAGLKVSIGPKGSATQAFARQILDSVGIDEKNTTFITQDREEGAEALIRGSIQAVFIVAPAEAPIIKRLMVTPDVQLMNVKRAEAFSRRFPAFQRIVLPRGVFDLLNDIPGNDTVLISSTATLGVDRDLHPGLMHLLLRAAREVHQSAGLLDHHGEFPAPCESGYVVSDVARRFYESGGSLLLKYLPFWAASLIDRLWVMLVPIFAVMVPLLRLLPPVYRWRIQSRIYSWYAALKALEVDFERCKATEPETIQTMMDRLDELEDGIHRTPTPLAFSSHLYVLREHVDLLRRRFEQRYRRHSTDATHTG